jgi:hypothetical protein
VAIFQLPESAAKLIEDSPLSIAVDASGLHASKPPGLATTLSELYSASLPPDDDLPGPSSADSLVSTSDDNQVSSIRELVLHVKRSDENHYGRIRRQEFYWNSDQERNRSMVQDDLAANVPLDGLAMIKASPVSLWSRIVNAKQDDVDSKKSLRQLYNDGLDPSRAEVEDKTPE